MKLKIVLSAFCLSILYCSAFAQNTIDIKEEQPTINNGIEYGYTIRNERSKEVGKEEYERFEITAYATNKSGCNQFYLKNDTFSLFGITHDPSTVAIFDCLNATGKRLTSKSSTVKARPFYVPYRQTTKNADGKSVTSTTQVQGGYLFRNGETISDNFIVIVPQGERPVFKCRMIAFSDL